jgi:hypothetical protein
MKRKTLKIIATIGLTFLWVILLASFVLNHFFKDKYILALGKFAPLGIPGVYLKYFLHSCYYDNLYLY